MRDRRKQAKYPERRHESAGDMSKSKERISESVKELKNKTTETRRHRVFIFLRVLRYALRALPQVCSSVVSSLDEAIYRASS